MKSPATVSPPSSGKLFSSGSRRDFLRVAAAGSAAVAIPAVLSSCKVGDTTLGATGPTGPLVTLDFSKGDTAYIQFVYIFKQLQTDFYTRALAAFSTSDLTTTEQSVMTEIKNHEVIHRDTVKAMLSTTDALTITPKWGTTNFSKAANVVTTARDLEDLSIGLLNGMFQHLISGTNIALLLEIHSVEGRHSAALRDELNPKSGTPTGYSPGASDPAYALSGVGVVIQPYINETLQFTNAPAGL